MKSDLHRSFDTMIEDHIADLSGIDARPANNDNRAVVRISFYGLAGYAFGQTVAWVTASQVLGMAAFAVVFVGLARLGERK